MNPHQSNVNLPGLPEEIWFEIIEVCELDSLYSMYLVNKLFQQRMKNMNLLPLWIFSVSNSFTCEINRENLERFTINFLGHHKFLQWIKHHKLEFLTYSELDKLFNNQKLSSMINMLEIDISYIVCSGYNYQSILEKVLHFPNITMLSLVRSRVIPRDFPEICSKNHFLQYLNLCDGILPLFMDFGTCSFVNFSLDNVSCKSGTSIKMPCCLKKCDLSCYQSHVGLLPNNSIEFQMSHCKELKTL
jgi:hypothetical protein